MIIIIHRLKTNRWNLDNMHDTSVTCSLPVHDICDGHFLSKWSFTEYTSAVTNLQNLAQCASKWTQTIVQHLWTNIDHRFNFLGRFYMCWIMNHGQHWNYIVWPIQIYNVPLFTMSMRKKIHAGCDHDTSKTNQLITYDYGFCQPIASAFYYVRNY